MDGLFFMFILFHERLVVLQEGQYPFLRHTSDSTQYPKALVGMGVLICDFRGAAHDHGPWIYCTQESCRRKRL